MKIAQSHFRVCCGTARGLELHINRVSISQSRTVPGSLSRCRSFSPTSGTDIYMDVPFAFCNKHLCPLLLSISPSRPAPIRHDSHSRLPKIRSLHGARKCRLPVSAPGPSKSSSDTRTSDSGLFSRAPGLPQEAISAHGAVCASSFCCVGPQKPSNFHD